MIFNLAKDFSQTPFGRYKSDGPNSAEKLRDVLIPLLQQCKLKKEKLTIELDDVPIGIGSSFIEEGFAGIIRHSDLSADDLRNLLVIKSEDESYIEEVGAYIDDAERVSQ